MPPRRETEGSRAYYAVLVGVMIAAIPASFGFIYSFADGIRKDQLAFTDNQIKNLYGPLHALAQSNSATWERFVMSGQAPDWNRVTPEKITLWRSWILNVFQPMNIQTENIIVSNAQLVVGNEFPGAFKRVIAHTEAYKALTSRWRPEDLGDPRTYTSAAENTVDLPYPNNFDECVGPIYNALKERQAYLQRSIFPIFSREPVKSPDQCN